MQKRLSFVPCEQKSHVFLHSSICLLFNASTVFGIFPISCDRLETACWLIPNYSVSCFCVCKLSSFNNSTSSIFVGFPYASCPQPLLKHQNHRSHVSPRSNRYDSATIFFKGKQKINSVRECSFFSIKYI